MRTAGICTTCRSKRQRVRQRPAYCGGALAGPIRCSRFGRIEGRQAARGGDSPQGFPLEASVARSAVGAKAGLKSNGRDGKGGTGCSPKARRRIAPTRPGRSRFPSRKRGHASDEMGAAYAAGYARDKPKTARARRADSAVGLEHRARPLPRPDLHFTAPRTERPGRGTDRGYSFVSMSHHTARGKARPVMG